MKTTYLLRKICVCILMILLSISSSVTCLAQNSNYLEHSVSNGVVTITGYRTFLGNELIIPEEIDGYPVTAIEKLTLSRLL